MAGPVIRGGRYATSYEAGYGYFGPNWQRANVFDSTSEPLIVYRLGMWAGRRSGTVRVRLGIGAAGSSPGSLYAQTAELSASTAYAENPGGAAVTGNVTPFVLPKGTFSLAALVTSGEMGHSMRHAASITATNRNFYDKANTSGSITSPIGGSGSYNGHMSIWFEAEKNVKPNRPTSLTVSSLLTLTPTLGSTFSDPNETLNNGVAYDYLNRYQVRVKRNSDGAYVVGTTTVTATSTERSNKRTVWTVPSGRLAYATPYTYEIRHEDRNGLWSDWASHGFTITSLSSVDRPTAPSGTITTLTPSITAVYRSQSGVAANAVQARLLTASGTVIRTGSVVSRSVANGAATTLTWAQAGLGTLAWGTGYQVQMRARDANGQWSPSWSPGQSFATIGAPGVPVNLTPSNGVARSARPLLQATATGATHVYAEIIRGGTVVQTRTMVKSGNTYTYQTTSADLPEHDTYQWRAYSYNGTLYSGEATTAAGAARSGTATFVYAPVPEVTVTGPASPVETVAPLVSWSAPAYDAYRIRAYRASDSVLVYDTGTAVGPSPTTLGPAHWLEPWRNGETINIIVSVRASGLWGDSAPWPLTLEYTPPASLDLQVFHHTLPTAAGPTAHRVLWSPTDIPGEDFARYELWRVELDADGATERPASRVMLAAITDPLITELLDAEVTSRQLYAYDIVQVAMLGNDEVPSTPTRVVSSVEWRGLVLHMPYDPQGTAVHLRSGAPGQPYEHVLRMQQNLRFEKPLGSFGRAVFFGRGHAHDVSGLFGVITDEYATVDERMDRLAHIYHTQNGDEGGRPRIVCWRDGRGGRHGRVYGVLVEPEITHEIAGYFGIQLELQEVAFALGETEGA